jgi:hypothetical protein
MSSSLVYSIDIGLIITVLHIFCCPMGFVFGIGKTLVKYFFQFIPHLALSTL